MGIDTIVKIPGKVESSKIFDFIKKNFDKNATNYVESKVQSDELLKEFRETKGYVVLGDELYFESGFISFDYKGERRNLFYFYANYYSFDNYTFKNNLHNNTRELNGDNTSLSLGATGYAVEILTQIAKEFGGYIDENDCDDEWFYIFELFGTTLDIGVKPTISISGSWTAFKTERMIVKNMKSQSPIF